MAKKLLFSITKKDLDISFFSGGKGGQHANRHLNKVRINHKPSGVMTIAGDQRSKEQNLRMAFKRLVNNKKFKVWLRIETARRMGKFLEIKEMIKQQTTSDNLKIEYYINNKWEEK